MIGFNPMLCTATQTLIAEPRAQRRPAVNTLMAFEDTPPSRPQRIHLFCFRRLIAQLLLVLNALLIFLIVLFEPLYTSGIWMRVSVLLSSGTNFIGVRLGPRLIVTTIQIGLLRLRSSYCFQILLGI